MKKVFSNGPAKDFVMNPFLHGMAASKSACLAAPYFTMPDEILKAAHAGKSVQLLVGLNASTSPHALSKLQGVPNISIRYLTKRFHAKIFIFDHCVLVGSANLTDGGLLSNREAVVELDAEEDVGAVEEVKSIFIELWDAAQVLTPEQLDKFRRAYEAVSKQSVNYDAIIENAVGKAEPVNINVDSKKVSGERLFLEGLRRQVYEEYRPSFNEITAILQENGFRRPELTDVGPANETNRFLNWVRQTYAIGDDAWRNATVRTKDDRNAQVVELGSEWSTAAESKIPKEYIDWLKLVISTFRDEATVRSASKEELTAGLMCLHAFIEQLRFVKGGAKNLPAAFWGANQNDVERVRATLLHLLFGQGDFIKRLHDVLYSPRFKLKSFGIFCALELYGTVRPNECPPINGRMAKALRYLGYKVQGA